MSYQIFLIVHLIGAFFVVFSLGGSLLQAIVSGDKNYEFKKAIGIIHGVGLLLLFVAGFGLIGKVGYSPIPFWIWIKMAIWVFFGVVSALAFRSKSKSKSKLLWAISIILFITVIVLVKIKPVI